MNEVEMCVNDTFQLTLEKEPLLTLNEAVTPGRLRWNCSKKNSSGVRSQGGNSSSSSSSSVSVAVWKKLHTTGTHPSPRWCHSGMLQGDDMLVFGGWSYERSVGVGSGSKFFNDVHVLNISTLVWTQLDTTGTPPRPRCQCACFLIQNKTVRNSDIGALITVETESNGKSETHPMQSTAVVRNSIESNISETCKDTENIQKDDSDLKSEVRVPMEVRTHESSNGQNMCPTNGVLNTSDSPDSDVNRSLKLLDIEPHSAASTPTVCPLLSSDTEKESQIVNPQVPEPINASTPSVCLPPKSPSSSPTLPLKMLRHESKNEGENKSDNEGSSKCGDDSNGHVRSLRREEDSEPLKSSKGYMVIFGGSCHNQEVGM